MQNAQARRQGARGEVLLPGVRPESSILSAVFRVGQKGRCGRGIDAGLLLGGNRDSHLHINHRLLPRSAIRGIAGNGG